MCKVCKIDNSSKCGVCHLNPKNVPLNIDKEQEGTIITFEEEA